MEDEDTIDVFQSQTGGIDEDTFLAKYVPILGKWFDLLCLNDIAILRNTWKLLNIKFYEKTIFLDLRMCEKYCFSVWFYLQELLKQKVTENFTFFIFDLYPVIIPNLDKKIGQVLNRASKWGFVFEDRQIKKCAQMFDSLKQCILKSQDVLWKGCLDIFYCKKKLITNRKTLIFNLASKLWGLV